MSEEQFQVFLDALNKSLTTIGDNQEAIYKEITTGFKALREHHVRISVENRELKEELSTVQAQLRVLIEKLK